MVMSKLTSASIRRDALIGDPDGFGWFAGLIEHVDGNAAARIPVAADAQPLGVDEISDAPRNGDGAIFVEGSVVAEGTEEKL